MKGTSVKHLVTFYKQIRLIFTTGGPAPTMQQQIKVTFNTKQGQKDYFRNNLHIFFECFNE